MPYAWVVAEQLGQADQAGDGAGDQHRGETMRLTLTPLATAAVGDRPVARRSKPKRVRLSSNQ